MFNAGVPANDKTGAALTAQFHENDKQNLALDDTAVLNSGITEGTVVKYSTSLSKWVLCNGTVALEGTDTIGVVAYASGTSGQVKTSGVYLDADLSTVGKYYCQSDGTIGTTPTKVFIGNVTSPGRLVLPGGGGGSSSPATTENLGGVIVGNGLNVDANGILSVNPDIPPWAQYKGDGSDGAFTAAGGEILSGIKQYTDFTIGTGLTVSVGAEPLVILCTGTVNIAGTLNGAGGQGGTAYTTVCAGGTGKGGGGAGGGVDAGSTYFAGGTGTGGGGGGNGKNDSATVAGGVSKFGDTQVAAATASPSAAYQALMVQVNYPFKAGAGGASGNGSSSSSNAGAGGGGGGTIILAADIVTNGGALNVSGGLKSTATGSNNNTNVGGGGGGAAIIIVAKEITISGTISVAGGAGGLAKYSVNNTNGGAGWYKIFQAGA